MKTMFVAGDLKGTLQTEFSNCPDGRRASRPARALRAREPTRSLNPIYTESDAVLEPALEGTWAEEDFTLSFTKSGENAYQVVLLTNDLKLNFKYSAHLTPLGGSLFLDIALEEINVNGQKLNDLGDLLTWLIPAHTFYRTRIERDTLRLECLDEDWIKEMIDGRKLKIAHAQIGDAFVLTAPTEKLQQFTRKYAASEAFRELVEFHRKK